MFTIVATIVFAALGIIWSKKTPMDLLFKIVLFALAIWGLIDYGIVVVPVNGE